MAWPEAALEDIVAWVAKHPHGTMMSSTERTDLLAAMKEAPAKNAYMR